MRRASTPATGSGATPGSPTGSTTTIGTNLTGWEWDAIPTQAQYLAQQPAGVKRLNETNVDHRSSRTSDWLQDEGRIYTRPRRRASRLRSRRSSTPAPAERWSSPPGTNDWATRARARGPRQPRSSSRRPTTSSPTWASSPRRRSASPSTRPPGPSRRRVVHDRAQPGADRADVTFDGSASTDTDGTIAKYEWDLDGNGTYETDTGTTRPPPTDLRQHRRAHRAAARHRRRRGVRSTTNRALSSTTAPSRQLRRPRVLGTTGLAQLLAPRATRRHARSSTPPAPATRPPHGAPTLGAPGALFGDPDTSAGFDGTNDSASAQPRPLEHQRGDGRVLDEVGRLRQRRRPGDGVHPELQLQRGRLPDRPQRGEQAGSSGRGPGQRRLAQQRLLRSVRPPAPGTTTPSCSTPPPRPRSRSRPTSTATPWPTPRPHRGTGAGTFANSQLYMMSRGGTQPVRQRQPRRGGHLRPGPQRDDDRHPLRRQPAAADRLVHGLARPGADRRRPSPSTPPPRSTPTARSRKYEWDLDGNGTYETDTGTTATTPHTYSDRRPGHVGCASPTAPARRARRPSR